MASARHRVDFDQTTTGTYAGVIGGDGEVIKAGTGTLTLSGSNTYSGSTLISAGTLQGDSTSLQAITETIPPAHPSKARWMCKTVARCAVTAPSWATSPATASCGPAGRWAR
ncbi:hypothetical protein EO087_03365 [Dyella sp. M7H15-1]|nr:hypothetical protein EO087_03365 [Dyella sp. M7H15-1]